MQTNNVLCPAASPLSYSRQAYWSPAPHNTHTWADSFWPPRELHWQLGRRQSHNARRMLRCLQVRARKQASGKELQNLPVQLVRTDAILKDQSSFGGHTGNWIDRTLLTTMHRARISCNACLFVVKRTGRKHSHCVRSWAGFQSCVARRVSVLDCRSTDPVSCGRWRLPRGGLRSRQRLLDSGRPG